MSSSFGSWVKVIFASAFLALTASGAISYWNTLELVAATAGVERTLQTLGQMEEFHSAITDAETGQRGFLLTNKDRYLEPYDSGVRRVDPVRRSLRQVAGERHRQQLDRLEVLVKDKLQVLEETIRLCQGGRREEAAARVLAGRGARAMDRIRAVLAEMKAEEEELLRRRHEEARRTARTTRATIVVAHLLVLALLGFAMVALSLAGRQRREAEQALRHSEAKVRSVLEAALHDISERERAEAALRQSEGHARRLADFNQAILANMGEGLYTVDRQDLATYLNPTAEGLLGWTSAELLGRPLHDLIHDQYPGSMPPPSAAADSGVLRQGGVLSAREGVFIRKDGTPFPVVYSSSPLLEQGEVRGLVVVFQDVTERKRAEDALRKSQALLAKAQELAHVGSYEVTFLPAPAVWWSDELYRIFGLESGQGPRSSEDYLARFVHPEDRPCVRQEIESGIREGRPLNQEYRVILADGTIKHIHSKGEMVLDEAGRVSKRVGCLMDVTERKESERRIREQAALIDRAHDAILVIDLGGRIRFWSQGAERLYGWTEEEVLGRDTLELVMPWHRGELGPARQSLLEKGEWSGEFRQRTRDGQELVVESRWSLLCDDQGRPVGKLVINTNVTDKKRLEAQVLRAQRLESIGVLAGGIAHDFNNLLTPMLMAVRLLKKGRSEEDRRGLLDTLEAGVARGGEVVRQLLSFAGGAEGRRGPLDLRHVLREAQGLLEHTLSKAVRLRAEVAADLWGVEGDSTQLSQVVMNLCVNARDAMPEGGELVIEADNVVLGDDLPATHPEAKAGPHVRVAVTDTGTGIPPPLLPKIFDPFFTTKGPGKGSGLGLPTAVGIVRSHGGFVSVYSEVGRGTCFTVYLPALPALEARPAGRERPPPPGGGGEWILVVDDEAAILLTVRATLEEHGYRVLTAADGTAALAAYGQHRGEIRAVLLDMMMPGLDGPGLMRALREVDPEVRILASSGLQPAGRNAEAITAGARTFLSKPYTDEQLLTALKEVLRPA